MESKFVSVFQDGQARFYEGSGAFLEEGIVLTTEKDFDDLIKELQDAKSLLYSTQEKGDILV